MFGWYRQTGRKATSPFCTQQRVVCVDHSEQRSASISRQPALWLNPKDEGFQMCTHTLTRAQSRQAWGGNRRSTPHIPFTSTFTESHPHQHLTVLKQINKCLFEPPTSPGGEEQPDSMNVLKHRGTSPRTPLGGICSSPALALQRKWRSGRGETKRDFLLQSVKLKSISSVCVRLWQYENDHRIYR